MNISPQYLQQLLQGRGGMPNQQSPYGYGNQQQQNLFSTNSSMGVSNTGVDPVANTAPGMAGVGNYLYGENPANEAMEYTSQLGATVSPYLEPYMQAGLGALDILFGQYGDLISQPQVIYDMLASGFQESPGYQYNYNQAMNASNSAAAAGGMLGSPAHTATSQAEAEQLANQEYQTYLNSMMNLYGMGLSGMGGINEMGYGATTKMTDYLAQELMANAYLSALAAQYSNSATGGLVGGITSSVTGGLF